jgi:hypothetical protein
LKTGTLTPLFNTKNNHIDILAIQIRVLTNTSSKAVRDEQTRLLIDKEESLNFNVDSKASVNFFYIPKRIAAPDYESKIYSFLPRLHL